MKVIFRLSAREMRQRDFTKSFFSCAIAFQAGKAARPAAVSHVKPVKSAARQRFNSVSRAVRERFNGIRLESPPVFALDKNQAIAPGCAGPYAVIR